MCHGDEVIDLSLLHRCWQKDGGMQRLSTGLGDTVEDVRAGRWSGDYFHAVGESQNTHHSEKQNQS